MSQTGSLNYLGNHTFCFVKKLTLYNYAYDNTMSQQADVAIARTVFESERIHGITWFNLNSMQANPDKIQVTVSRKKDFENSKIYYV